MRRAAAMFRAQRDAQSRQDLVEDQSMRQLSRRAALALGAAGAALGFVGSGKAAEKGKVSIELPEIAENGNTVPLSVTVDAPMANDNYVSDILVVADGNPNPGVATFHFSPISGKAAASTRIRLAATQNIIAVAKTSKGEFFTNQKLVKGTIGGCGG